MEKKISAEELGITNIHYPSISKIFNGAEYFIKTYLPTYEKLELIQDIAQQCVTNNDYYNPAQISILTRVGIAEAYTNIEFPTEMDKGEIYDIIMQSGLWSTLINAIPYEEYTYITQMIEECVRAIYEYTNSFRGVMKSFASDTEGEEEKNNEMIKNLQDVVNEADLTTLKEIMEKMV